MSPLSEETMLQPVPLQLLTSLILGPQPSFLNFIPKNNSVDSVVARLPNLSDWYYSPFFPIEEPFDPLTIPERGWSHGGCTCLCRCPSGI